MAGSRASSAANEGGSVAKRAHHMSTPSGPVRCQLLQSVRKHTCTSLDAPFRISCLKRPFGMITCRELQDPRESVKTFLSTTQEKQAQWQADVAALASCVAILSHPICASPPSASLRAPRNLSIQALPANSFLPSFPNTATPLAQTRQSRGLTHWQDPCSR